MTPTIRLLHPLGQGAMGSVWVAEHLALGTRVAVKFMAPGYADDERSVLRFRQEAQAAARIKSPYVTTVFDHGITDKGQPFIVMELLDGETLRQRMKRSGPIPIKEVVQLVGQAARGLGSAHRLGIVHRDIKPDNLFVIDVEGEAFVKVLDFGIAKQVQAELGVTSTGVAMGTPLYMSPEQLGDAKRVDHRTDLWALGVVTYEALTGKLPFKGSTVWALALAVQKGAFTPPSVLRPELPPAVDAWMARALALDVEARFGEAVQMADALAIAAQRNPMAFADTSPTPTQLVPPNEASADGDPAPVREEVIRNLPRPPPASYERAVARHDLPPGSGLLVADVQSIYISYGAFDSNFARRLSDALSSHGITTFLFARDATPGKKLHRLVRDGVNRHDRVVLICSKASLDQPRVLNEITETLQRESRDGGKDYLIPITLDDYVFSGWKPDDAGLAMAIRDRVVADFRGTDIDQGKFHEGVLRLVAALVTPTIAR